MDALIKKRVLLRFPPGVVEQPLTYHLVKDFDLIPNILFARISPEEEGKLVLEVGNSSEEKIERGLDYLREHGVQVEALTREIIWNEAECIHCGACTAVCRPKALALDPRTAELSFDQGKCIVCEQCVTACPLGILRVSF